MSGSTVECEIYPLLRVGPRSLTEAVTNEIEDQFWDSERNLEEGASEDEHLPVQSTDKVLLKSSLSSGSESVHGIGASLERRTHTTMVNDLAGIEPRSRYPSIKLVWIASESQEGLEKFITLAYPDREGRYDQVPVLLALIGEYLKPQCKENHLAYLTYWYGLASVTPKPLVLTHSTLKVSFLWALLLTKGSSYGTSARPENCVPTLYNKNSRKKFKTLLVGTQEPIGAGFEAANEIETERWFLDMKHYEPGLATISVVNPKEKIVQCPTSRRKSGTVAKEVKSHPQAHLKDESLFQFRLPWDCFDKFGVLKISYVLGILPEGSGKPLYLNGGFNGTSYLVLSFSL
ncbi:hypothetical protein M9H77_36269 [Catharanthus roseus]|uniref:Uncharacterized protein n=1 Tax=Catharanthus roseus TaxID=4058 RepID=A0ACB9ZT56_CATRO|nr:hypothetical protein M9H77_36269 [Catharanthus roseus]